MLTLHYSIMNLQVTTAARQIQVNAKLSEAVVECFTLFQPKIK